MNVALIYSGKPIIEMEWLTTALTKRGHTYEYVPLTGLRIEDLTPEAIQALLAPFDLVYYRTGYGDAGRIQFGRCLVGLDVVAINPAVFTDSLCSNKIHQGMRAHELDIRIPETYIGRNTPFEKLVERVGKPLIVKGANGIQGKSVFLVRDDAGMQAAVEDIKREVLVQACIPNDGDYRVFTIGGKVHEMYKRIPPQGSFKANFSAGGTGERVDDEALRAELSAIACTMSDAMQLDIAGIDIIRSKETGECFFIEANVNPGWKGLDLTVGCDTADAIVTYFESRVATAQVVESQLPTNARAI